MAVACDQDVSATVLGELDQVVVTAISRHDPRRVDWIGEPDRFLFNATAEFINFIQSDAVDACDALVQERLAHFAQELRAGDHFEYAFAPQVEEPRCCPRCRQGFGDQTICIDDGLQPAIRTLTIGPAMFWIGDSVCPRVRPDAPNHQLPPRQVRPLL